MSPKFLFCILGNLVEILLQVSEKWYQGHFEQLPHQQVRGLVSLFFFFLMECISFLIFENTCKYFFTNLEAI